MSYGICFFLFLFSERLETRQIYLHINKYTMKTVLYIATVKKYPGLSHVISPIGPVPTKITLNKTRICISVSNILKSADILSMATKILEKSKVFQNPNNPKDPKK